MLSSSSVAGLQRKRDPCILLIKRKDGGDDDIGDGRIEPLVLLLASANLEDGDDGVVEGELDEI